MEAQNNFTILNRVDSTNNYAMGQVHANLAKHGQAWFAHEQTAGKGQRGRAWQSETGKNIILTVAFQPPKVFKPGLFTFNALISLTCAGLLEQLADGEKVFLKWPNDLYLRDRKAGGILIENVMHGHQWRWAVVGIGININQTLFNDGATNATSLQQVTGNTHDVIALAKQLQQHLVQTIDNSVNRSSETILDLYQQCLYQKGQVVKLKKDNAVFNTTITGVDVFGNLHTQDVMERQFSVGEVTFMNI